MKKITLLFLSFSAAFCSTTLNAQVWDTLAKFNQVIADLQTFNNSLFIAGDFTTEGTNTCYWSSYYTGTGLVDQTNMIGGSGIRKMDMFGTDLYTADALDYGGVMGVGLWDGVSSWTDGGSTNYSHSVVHADGNDLYVCSDDGKVRKKTGAGSFTSFYNFSSTEGLSCIMRYNSLLIFAGSFTSIGGVAANNIAGWNGSTWVALGSGITGGAGCMAVFNNELYVAGGLTAAGGNPVSYIAKWNGTSWSAVGGGVTSTCYNGIRDMKAYGSNLYVVGDFSQMGSVNTTNVAMWNGSQWKGLNLTHHDSFINCVEVYNGELYVGSFDFNHGHVFHLQGAAGVNENNNAADINVYPNPSSGKANVQISQFENLKMTTIEIYDSQGEKICDNSNLKINTSSNFQIDLSGAPVGIYFLQIKTPEGVAVKKIVRE